MDLTPGVLLMTPKAHGKEQSAVCWDRWELCIPKLDAERAPYWEGAQLPTGHPPLNQALAFS